MAELESQAPGVLLASLLAPWFTGTAARYGHPVYLVGSGTATVTFADIDALRDVDVSCVLPDDEFFARFGCDWQMTEGGGAHAGRWAAEVGKLSSQAAKWCRRNIDFKVMSQSWQNARSANKPRVRIDVADFDDTQPLTPERAKSLLQRAAAGANDLKRQLDRLGTLTPESQPVAGRKH